MSNALRALPANVARELNRVMQTHRPRFDDRYHEHILSTPTEVGNALHYVLDNQAVHLARRGINAPLFDDHRCSLALAELVKRPRSWLLREGWTRAEPPP